MPISNYEQTRNRMRQAFLKYDQRKMTEKFHLKQDEQYLYVNFCSRNYGIERGTGTVVWWKDGSRIEADFNVSMTIYDVFVLLCAGLPSRRQILLSLRRKGLRQNRSGRR